MSGYKQAKYAVSVTNTVVILLGSGLVCALFTGVSTCAASSDCGRTGTCQSTQESFCGLSNVVGIITDAQYGGADTINTTDTTSAAALLSSLLRGLCSPGDRTQLNPRSRQVECVPFFPFPSGINEELMDSSKSTPAGQACGKWIDAGGSPLFIDRVTRRGNYDNTEWVTDLLNSEDVATRSSRTATTSMAKFRQECLRTATSGPRALRTAATMSYDYLNEYIDAHAANVTGFLKSIGYLMGHRCPTTTVAGTYLEITGNHKLLLSSGYTFSQTVLARALSVFDVDVQTQHDAEDANRAITKAFFYDPLDQPTLADLYAVLEGATGISNFTVDLPLNNVSLLQAATDSYNANPTKATAYLRGMAAFCSFTSYSEFFPTSLSYDAVLDDQLNRIRSSSPKASSLGRLERVEEEPDIYHDALNATTMTLSHVLGGGGTGNPDADCLGVMRAVFSDEVEEARFEATIPNALYDRLQNMVFSIRVAVGVAANTYPLNTVIRNVTEFSHRVSTAGVKIVGAPRGSWAGVARRIPRGELSTSDGMFLMILKHAKAGFIDEIVNVGILQSVHACDHTPFASQTIWNAYILQDLDCSKYFLGMAHRPMLDAAYDDATLASRFLHIVGHELGHIAESVGFNYDNYTALLSNYHPDTLSEGIADLIGAVASLSTGLVNRQDFITLFCQVWCAREPFGFTHPITTPKTVHPSGNSRCDNLVATLDQFFPNL